MKTHCLNLVLEKLVALKPHAVIGPLVDYHTDFRGRRGPSFFTCNHSAFGFSTMSVGLTRGGRKGPTTEFGLN